MTHSDDEFDRRLARSAPPVTGPSARLDDALLNLVVASEVEARRRSPRRTRNAVIGVGALVAVTLGGVGTAAAVNGWEPWAQDPTGVYTFTLPSGAECEIRAGQFESDDPELLPAIEEVFAEVDVVAEADVEAEIAAVRQPGVSWFAGPDGNEPAGYGTEHYNADMEYHDAMRRAVSQVLTIELHERGFDGGWSIMWRDQSQCPGAAW